MTLEKSETSSCSTGLTRKEFIKTVFERSAAAGVLAVAANAFTAFRPAPVLAAPSGSPPPP